MIDLAELPDEWSAALDLIAADKYGLIVGVICLPGGSRTADGLATLGFVERVARRPGYVTFTPWGAVMLGVEPYEWEDDGEPTWVLSSRVAEDERVGCRPIVCPPERGHVRAEIEDRSEGCREWYVDGDGDGTYRSRNEKRSAARKSPKVGQLRGGTGDAA